MKADVNFLKVVATYSEPEEALNSITSVKPDVVSTGNIIASNIQFIGPTNLFHTKY